MCLNSFHYFRPEELYDREEVFGRDVSSVFPNAKKDKTDGAEAGSELATAAASKRFISESEVRT